MSQPMEDRTVTANQARAEYVAKCNEIKMIKTAQRYIEVALDRVLQRSEPLVLFPEIGSTVHAVDMFWLLLDIYSDSEKLLRDATVARDYAYAVWKSASAEPHRG